MHWLRRVATLSVLLAATAALPTSDAAYCTDDQAEAIESEQLLGRGNAYSSACSMISANKFKLDAVSWMNETELAGVAGCKAPVCLDALRTMVSQLPDCEYYVYDPKNAFNLKTGYTIVLSMCEQFAKGPVTKAELVALFKPVEKFDGSRDGVLMGDVTTAPPTTLPPPSTPAPTPTPTPTSKNECVQKQLDNVEEEESDYRDACKSTSLSVSRYTLDHYYLSDTSLQTVCKEDKCIDAVRKLVRAYPQCVVQGVDISRASRASYEDFERACASAGKQIVPLQGWPSSAASHSRLSSSRGAVAAWTLLLSAVGVALY